ncbi:MAG: DEAD/DEAH box helicase, partial [Myxococcales bacterium]
YELVLRHPDAFAALQPDVLVLDEAQRAKNFRARTAAVLRGIRSRFLFALTALPLDRHLDDLYALVQLVDDELLSPLWRFNFTYYEQDARGRITAYKNLSRLRLLLAPLLVRRRKEEIAAQLPALTRQQRTTPLLPEQRSRSQEALGALALELRGRTPAGEALAARLAEARAACADPSLLSPDDETVASPKLDELEQLIEEIAQQGPHRVLVFGEHGEILRRAAARLERLGLTAIVADRSLEEARRHLMARRVTGHAEALVVLLTDAACARLELPAVTYHVHLDVPLGPGQLARRTAVGLRPGQRGLTEVFLCADGGVEAALAAALLGRVPRPHEALEQAATSGAFNGEALALLRRLVDEALPGVLEDEPDEPPRTPPVAHLSLSPTPPTVAPVVAAPIEITGAGPARPPPRP